MICSALLCSALLCSGFTFTHFGYEIESCGICESMHICLNWRFDKEEIDEAARSFLDTDVND
jgi:hypothetical protein